MPLVLLTLENAIAAAMEPVLSDLDPEATAASKSRDFAKAMAPASDAFVRSAVVSTAVSTAVVGTITPAGAVAGTGTGTGTGSLS